MIRLAVLAAHDEAGGNGGAADRDETLATENRVEIHAADTIREGHFVCNSRAPHQVSLRPDPKARTVGLRLGHARD